MKDLPIIYTVRLDVSEEVEEEANRWCDTTHISDLLAAGFLSATRFRSVRGEPRYLHVYELPGTDLLSTEAYANVSKNDDWGSKIMPSFSNHSASLYQQVLTVNVPETPEGVRGNYLITVRMDVAPEAADELVRWHREEHIPLILEAKGVTSARLCRKHGQHPRSPSHDPEWVSFYEIDSLDALKDPKVKESNETVWAKRMHAMTSEVRFGVLERIFPP